MSVADACSEAMGNTCHSIITQVGLFIYTFVAVAVDVVAVVVVGFIGEFSDRIDILAAHFKLTC